MEATEESNWTTPRLNFLFFNVIVSKMLICRNHYEFKDNLTKHYYIFLCLVIIQFIDLANELKEKEQTQNVTG